MTTAKITTTVEVDCREVAISNPDRVVFRERGETKMDLVRYYLAVGEGALRGVHGRPITMKRYREGAEGEAFYQKRIPSGRPDWVHTHVVPFPSGRTAEELCPLEVAHLVWAVNLGCLHFDPWNSRCADLEHPDELRVDLDPEPGVPFEAVREVALVAKDVLEEHGGLVGYPKTSGASGIHVYVRIEPRWSFPEVRQAALALAKEVERRVPHLATTTWWKDQREQKVFVDYNQNARDHTIASAYSVRATPDARVSTPLWWDEVADVDPAAFTIATVPARYASMGDPSAGIDDAASSIDALLALAAE